MGIPVATALGRRDRMWPAVSLSALAHVGLIAWGLTRSPPPPIDLEQKPIVARLVRLGEKRPEQWLPRKEAAPPPAAPPAPVQVPVPAAHPKAPAAPSASPKAAPPRPAPSSTGRSGTSSLASVLSKVQKQVDDQRWGDPEGDAAGDSSEGSAGDRYYALVYREIHGNYRVPATIQDRRWSSLKAIVVLRIQPDGTIARYTFDKPSGNPAFDEAVERAVRQTRRVPPPPDSLRETFRSSGLAVIFQNE